MIPVFHARAFSTDVELDRGRTRRRPARQFIIRLICGAVLALFAPSAIAARAPDIAQATEPVPGKSVV